MKTFKNIAFVLSTCLFVIFAIVCIFLSIVLVFHAFSNPSFTTTENILWLFESKWKVLSIVGCVGMFISYVVMNILYEDRKNK